MCTLRSVYFMLFPFRDNNFIIFCRVIHSFSLPTCFFSLSLSLFSGWRIFVQHTSFNRFSIIDAVDVSVSAVATIVGVVIIVVFVVVLFFLSHLLFYLRWILCFFPFLTHWEWVFIICVLWYVSHQIAPFEIPRIKIYWSKYPHEHTHMSTQIKKNELVLWLVFPPFIRAVHSSHPPTRMLV